MKLTLLSLGFIFLLGFIGVKPVKAAIPCLIDATHFCDSYDGAKPAARTKMVSQPSACTHNEWPSNVGGRSGIQFKGVIDKSPCPEVASLNIGGIRGYPAYDFNYQLPVLVFFWMYIDASSYTQCCADRFSQGSYWEQSGGGTQVARIFTTHVRDDGTYDFGHAQMSFRSTAVKAPLKKWNLQSVYIENRSDGKTYVTLWSDDRVVVKGRVENAFRGGAFREAHFGMYADREGLGGGLFAVLNDELKVIRVSGISEAATLIGQELGTGPVETAGSGPSSPGSFKPECSDGNDNDGDGAIDYPSDKECSSSSSNDELGGSAPPSTATPKPTSTPGSGTPTPTPTTGSASTKFKIGDRVEVTLPLNVRTQPGEGTILGTQPSGVKGAVTGGPQLGVGGNSWWWDINYDSGVDGWSSEDSLKKEGAAVTPTQPSGIAGDIDGDGDVDIFDYNILASNFGSSNCGNVADIDGNCKVDIFDYNILVSAFGGVNPTLTPTSKPSSSPTPLPTQPPTGSCDSVISAASAGAIIRLQTGNQTVCFERGKTYNSIIEITGSNLTLGASGSGANPIVNAGGQNYGVYIRANDVIVKDLEFQNATFGVDVSDAANRVSIENVTSHDNTHGMRLGKGIGNAVKNCTVYNNTQNGIVFDTDGMIISGCKIYDNSVRVGSFAGLYHGIYGSDGCKNTTIEGNTIYGVNNGNGINFKCRSGTVRNNTIYDTGNAIHLEDQCPNPDEIPVNGKCSVRSFGTVEVYGNNVHDNERGIVLYDYDWNTDVTVNVHNNTTTSNSKSKSPEPEGELDIQVTTAKIILNNNIFNAGSTCASGCFKSVSQSASGMDSNNNCFYRAGGSDTNTFSYAGNNYNFSGWKTQTGDDANSFFASPISAQCSSKGK